MYIRIINKNRIDTDNDYTDFAAFPIDEGCVYTQVYGEELDSFECRVSNLQSTIEIEPFDRVAIYDNNDTLLNVMDVENYVCDMQGYLGDTTYTYDISLCSMTKELENYILPNLSITPRKVGTRLTVQDYIVRYRDLFAPNIIIDFEMNFDNLAPELQWNEPTLREVLTSLMMTRDCIPVMKYKNNAIVLSYMDLTKKGNEITGYNYVRSSRSMSDYNSELRMTMQNVMQPDSVVTTVEYIPLTSSNYLVNSDNVVLKTQFPILNIKHLWITYTDADTQSSSGNDGFYLDDLMNAKTTDPSDIGGKLVYEEQEFLTLPKVYRGLAAQRVDNYYSKYQNFCLHYKRGSNVIEGFTDTTLSNLLQVQTSQWIKEIILGSRFSPQTEPDNYYFDTFFKIEYETMYDQVFQASKERQQSHHRVLADNQQFSWVDANTQANLEYQKANRLGNDVVLINGRNMEIELGDTLNDNIVYKIEKQIYTYHADVNAYATKNYILRDKFTAIDAKIRTYVNAQNEAFIRSDLKKFYCVFQSFPVNDPYVNYAGLSQALVSPLDEQAHTQSIKYCAMYNDDFPLGVGDSLHFSATLLKRQLGKSMVFSFGFNDNWVAGTSVNITQTHMDSNNPTIKKTYTDEKGGIPLTPLQYVNEDGEMETMNYKLAYDMYNTWDQVHNIGITDLDSGLTIAEVWEAALWNYNQPLINYYALDGDQDNDSFVVFEDTLTVYKDNKEIPMFNIQFEFISNDNDILVTNKWVELQKWLNDYDTAKPYTIYSSPVANWNFRSNALPSDTTQLQGTTLQIDYSQNNRAKITLQNTSNQLCYYVVIDGEVVLGFVGQTGTTNIYMNILSKRDQNTYNAKGVIVNG